ncbi:hypothetical protein [Xanthobacter sp. KR7-225]|uniref:hypothetical protein n=1 Tax=Xanthobacter sp. KR7-225 TaxID=3156613 RepID=UPI0032B31001
MAADEKPVDAEASHGLRKQSFGGDKSEDTNIPSEIQAAPPGWLECELLARSDFPSREGLAALRAAGVADALIIEVRETDARFFPLRRWDFGEGGLASLVFPMRDAFGEIIDALAWPVTRPDKWARLTGRAILLGEESLGLARLGEPVPCWRTPLRWLAAAGDGLVILDTVSAWRRLRPGPALAAEDHEHAREVRAALAPPGPPSVAVRKAAYMRRAAA